MVEVEFLKDLGVFKKGQTVSIQKDVASDMIRYNKDSVQLKTLKKKSKKKD